MQRRFLYPTILLLFGACTKQGHPYYNDYGSSVSSGSTLNSNVRVVSVCTVPGNSAFSTSYQFGPDLTPGYLLWDLKLNGQSMTNMGIGAYSNYLQTSSSASLFGNNTNANPIPSSAKQGGLLPGQPGTSTPSAPGATAHPLSVPDSLLNSSGQAHVGVNFVYALYQNRQHVRDSAVTKFDTTLANNATDIYFFNNAFSSLSSSTTDLSVKVVSRDVSVSDPSKFKIRLINLSHADLSSALPGGGSVSLYNAASKALNSATSNIAPGQCSSYIELPYGTYQFRTYDEYFLQVPGSSTYNFMQSNPGNNYQNSSIAYSPIRTYLPGGVYTIVVYDNLFYGSDGNVHITPNTILVQDNSPATNYTYSNIQWANGLAGSNQLHLQIDGEDLQGPLDYTASSGYQSYTTGQHSLVLKDNSGNTLANQGFSLVSMNNYTIWVYGDARNNAQLQFVSNSMDFTNNGVQTSSDFNFAARFINYCPDAADITFTTSNYNTTTNDVGAVSYPWGASTDASAVLNGASTVPLKTYENLAFATPITDTPYLLAPYPGTAPNGSTFYPLYKLNAFLSQASPEVIVPGQAITGLSAISLPFIDNSAIYSDSNSIPYSDAGVFSAALVGRISPADASQNVQLMVIKHIQ